MSSQFYREPAQHDRLVTGGCYWARSSRTDCICVRFITVDKAKLRNKHLYVLIRNVVDFIPGKQSWVHRKLPPRLWGAQLTDAVRLDFSNLTVPCWNHIWPPEESFLNSGNQWALRVSCGPFSLEAGAQLPALKQHVLLAAQLKASQMKDSQSVHGPRLREAVTVWTRLRRLLLECNLLQITHHLFHSNHTGSPLELLGFGK